MEIAPERFCTDETKTPNAAAGDAGMRRSVIPASVVRRGSIPDVERKLAESSAGGHTKGV